MDKFNGFLIQFSWDHEEIWLSAIFSVDYSQNLKHLLRVEMINEISGVRGRHVG